MFRNSLMFTLALVITACSPAGFGENADGSARDGIQYDADGNPIEPVTQAPDCDEDDEACQPGEPTAVPTDVPPTEPEDYCDEYPEDPNCWEEPTPTDVPTAEPTPEPPTEPSDYCDEYPEDPNCWEEPTPTDVPTAEPTPEPPTEPGDYCDEYPEDPNCWEEPTPEPPTEPVDCDAHPDCCEPAPEPTPEPPCYDEDGGDACDEPCDDEDDPACWGEPTPPAPQSGEDMIRNCNGDAGYEVVRTDGDSGLGVYGIGIYETHGNHSGNNHPMGEASVTVYENVDILVLTSHEPVTWNIDLGPNADIGLIYVIGYYDQVVVLPQDSNAAIQSLEGYPLEEASFSDHDELDLYGYGIESFTQFETCYQANEFIIGQQQAPAPTICADAEPVPVECGDHAAFADGEGYESLAAALETEASLIEVCPGEHPLWATASNVTIRSLSSSPHDTWITGLGGTILSGNDLHLEGLTFANGHSDYAGGALSLSGDSTVVCSQFLENSAGYEGGAIQARGDLLVEGSRFIGNYADYEGGAISWGSSTDGNLTVNDSHFENNQADYEGAAIEIGTWAFDHATLTGSTFADNNSPRGQVNFGSWGGFNGSIDSCHFSGGTTAIELGGHLLDGYELDVSVTTFDGESGTW